MRATKVVKVVANFIVEGGMRVRILKKTREPNSRELSKKHKRQ
jgi:hypothetical protein